MMQQSDTTKCSNLSYIRYLVNAVPVQMNELLSSLNIGLHTYRIFIIFFMAYWYCYVNWFSQLQKKILVDNAYY